MKKTISIIVILLLIITVNAQEEETIGNKNEIGIVVSDFSNGAYQFTYERVIGEHFSVGIGAGIKGENGLIRLSGLDTDQIKTSNLTYSGFKIIPEVRYYINKTQQSNLDGFYFGAYIKYSNYNSDLFGTYITDLSETYEVDFDANLNVTSLGFMVGYKLPISRRLNLDFLIAGPGAGFHSYSIKNIKTPPDEFYEDLNVALDRYSIFDLLNSNFNFKINNSKTKFVFPAFRYGLGLGYTF